MGQLTLTTARQKELLAMDPLKRQGTPEWKQWLKDLKYKETSEDYVREAIIVDPSPAHKLETLYQANVITKTGEYDIFTFNPFITLKTLHERQAQAFKQEHPVHITFFRANYPPTSVMGIISLDAGLVETVEFTGRVLNDVDLNESPVVRAYFEAGAAAVAEERVRAGIERLMGAIANEAEDYADEYEEHGDDEYDDLDDDYEDDDDEDDAEDGVKCTAEPSKLVLSEDRQAYLLRLTAHDHGFSTDYHSEPEYELWLDDENYGGPFREYIQGAHISDTGYVVH